MMDRTKMRRWTAMALAGLVTLGAAATTAPYWQALASVAVSSEACDQGLMAQAEARVESFFQGYRSKPLVRCTRKSALGLSVQTASARFAPLLPTLIVIGPEGQNVDVIAHEIAHAEIRARVGLVVRELRLPTWFDEGLAMQVDRREPFVSMAALDLSRGTAVPPLAGLQTGKRFFVAGYQGTVHYTLARCVIGEVLGTKKADAALRYVSLWESLPEEPFAEAEARCRAMALEVRVRL